MASILLFSENTFKVVMFLNATKPGDLSRPAKQVLRSNEKPIHLRQHEPDTLANACLPRARCGVPEKEDAPDQKMDNAPLGAMAFCFRIRTLPPEASGSCEATRFGLALADRLRCRRNQAELE
ncbi:hypothetical protein [Camelimonas lactis]|uniref:hypothetical protein n=1 Tax=Camelimonas lactis TaxID=659006 RepID=UPI00104D62A1|nr:hypothetical protein [Camelimonas lactis]